MTSRLGFLDGVRGVAALAVAVGHASEIFWPSFFRWSADWFSPGRAGVCAFFLASGFVIPISLERAAVGAPPRVALRDFAISRVCRLYPMYWASLALVLLVAALGFEAMPADFEAELPGSALVNLTMAQELVGVPHAMGLYYTLTIELVWYLTCAALLALGWLHATERLAWAALAGLAALGIGGPLVLDRHTPFSTGFYLLTMLLGTALARHAAGVLPTGRVFALFGTAAVVAVAGAWANYIEVPGAVDPEGVLGITSALLPWAVAYTAVLAAYATRDRGASFPRWLTWLGLVSYSVYLLHPLVIAIAVELAGGPWVQLAVTLLATVVAAALTQRLIERPGEALGRRWRARVPIRA